MLMLLRLFLVGFELCCGSGCGKCTFAGCERRSVFILHFEISDAYYDTWYQTNTSTLFTFPFGSCFNDSRWI